MAFVVYAQAEWLRRWVRARGKKDSGKRIWRVMAKQDVRIVRN